jgi:hypothetical protein
MKKISGSLCGKTAWPSFNGFSVMKSQGSIHGKRVFNSLFKLYNMVIDFQISERRLLQILKINIERNVFAREDLGLGGIRNLFFFRDLAALFRREYSTEEGVVNSIRINTISFDNPRSAGLLPEMTTFSTPPQAPFTSVFGFPLPPVTATPLTIAVPPVVVKALVDVHCVKRSDLDAAGGNPVAADRTTTIQLSLIYKVAPPASVDGSITLQPELLSVKLGINPLFIQAPAAGILMELNPEEQLAAFREANFGLEYIESDEDAGQILDLLLLLNSEANRALFAIPAIPLNTSAFADTLNSLIPGGGFRLWNAGIRRNSGIFHLRLQYELGTALDFGGILAGVFAGVWNGFFNDMLPNRLNGNDWAAFLPSEVFIRAINEQTRNGLSGRTDIVLNRDGMPRTTWNITGAMPGMLCHPGATVGMHTVFSVSALGACKPWGFNVDVNCSLDLRLSMPREGFLRTDLRLNFSPDEGDMILCSLANSFLLSSAGFIIGGTFGGYIGGAIVAAVFGVAGGIGTLVAGYAYSPGVLSLGQLQPVPGSDRDYFMETNFNFPANDSLGTITPLSIMPCNDGLTINGSFGLAENSMFVLGNQQQAPAAFTWNTINCSSDVLTLGSFASWNLDRIRPGFSTLPMRKWGLTVIESSPAPFPLLLAGATVEFSGVCSLVINLSQADAATLLQQMDTDGLERFSIKLLLQTNIGARIFTLEGERALLTTETMDNALEMRQRFCAAASRMRNLRRIPERFRSLVGPRPAIKPAGARFRYLMAAAVNAIPGETLQLGYLNLESKKTRSIRNYKILKGQPVVFSVMQSAESDAFDYTLQLSADEQQPIPESAMDNGAIALSHAVIEETAHFPLSGNYTAVAMAAIAGGPALALLTDKEIAIYTFANEYHPYLLAVIPAGLCKGIQWFEGKLAYWGECGAGYYDTTTRHWQSFTQKKATGVAESFGAWWVKEAKTWKLVNGSKLVDGQKTPQVYPQGFQFVHTMYDENGEFVYAQKHKKFITTYTKKSNHVSLHCIRSVTNM